MLKKLIGGLSTTGIQYIPFEGRLPVPVNIKLPSKITLILDEPSDGKEPILIKAGDPVKTGQKLTLFQSSPAYAISPATGTVSAVTPFRGDLGQVGTAVSIDTSPEEEWDDAFAAAVILQGYLDEHLENKFEELNEFD